MRVESVTGVCSVRMVCHHVVAAGRWAVWNSFITVVLSLEKADGRLNRTKFPLPFQADY
jgi:hypothetical protein